MGEISVGIIEGLLTMSIGGLAWWLWRLEDKNAELKDRLDEHRVDLAKNYHSKEELRQVVNDAIFPLREEISRLARVVEKVFDRGEH